MFIINEQESIINLSIVNMSQNTETQLVRQFRTVVTSYRLHGKLIKIQQAQSIFQLNIVSSANLEEAYQIIFDNKFLFSYNLQDVFPSPKQLYEHLSKMTKMKMKLNSQTKKLLIIHQKQKIVQQFSIDLVDVQKNSKKEQMISQIISKQKIKNSEQSNTFSDVVKQQLKENPLNEYKLVEVKREQVKKQQNIIQQFEKEISPEEKIQQLKMLFERMHKTNSSVNQSRQSKEISYNFFKGQGQSLTLYQYCLEHRIDAVADLIQSSEIQKTDQIIIKRKKLNTIPPFNQIALQSLKHLSLQQNMINVIENLQSLLNLERLNLDGNSISSIQNLSHLEKLTHLKLGNNSISKIQGLQKLVNLETLWLDFNSIQKIEGLSHLQKLKSLNLSFNLITKIQNLACLGDLEELLLNQNQIEQIENLQGLSKLIRLTLNMNQIKRIKGLKKLLLLEIVHLSSNRIQVVDKNAFDELNWLKMLKDLKLNGNCIEWTEESLNFVERLKKYGVKIST